jgi:hypothetical protein
VVKGDGMSAECGAEKVNPTSTGNKVVVIKPASRHIISCYPGLS